MVPAARSLLEDPGYRRRAPEHSLLYQLVAAEADGLREAVSAASLYGRGLPRNVDKELDAFLECGLLHRGFARVLCKRCRVEHLLAFSCKGRGICPSCTARRMSDTAAHLVDRVLPHCRYRQWVITFPRRVRHHLAADPKLASAALQQGLRAIFAWQRKQARLVGEKPGRANSNAAITMVQRFNSALELSLHFHVLIPDGVFIANGEDPDARPRLVELPEPTDHDVAALLDTIIDRVTRTLKKHGRLDDDNDDEPEPQLLIALRPARAPGGGPFVADPLPRQCARKDGYSLHAMPPWIRFAGESPDIRAQERSRRPRAPVRLPAGRRSLRSFGRQCRYGLRPALSQGRLSRADDGTVLYQMKRRYSDGRHVLRFEPREFLLRLCALVPPRRFNMIRYSGLFAPHARGRFAITGRGMRDNPRPAPKPPAPTTPPKPREPLAHPDGPDDPSRQQAPFGFDLRGNPPAWTGRPCSSGPSASTPSGARTAHRGWS